jgi:hypothetical protein
VKKLEIKIGDNSKRTFSFFIPVRSAFRATVQVYIRNILNILYNIHYINYTLIDTCSRQFPVVGYMYASLFKYRQSARLAIYTIFICVPVRRAKLTPGQVFFLQISQCRCWLHVLPLYSNIVKAPAWRYINFSFVYLSGVRNTRPDSFFYKLANARFFDNE